MATDSPEVIPAVADEVVNEIVNEVVSEAVNESVNESVTNETPVLTEIVEKENSGTVTGQVKWFNDRYGYGFVTINDGDRKGQDIFVHHSGIKPANSNYKTLRKGEYVNFNIIKGLNGLQAVDITGINGGPLMCDIVMGSRRMGEGYVQQPPPPPPRDQSKPVAGPNPNWQTVTRKPHGKPTTTRPVKNYNKYNKATRHLPAGVSA